MKTESRSTDQDREWRRWHQTESGSTDEDGEWVDGSSSSLVLFFHQKMRVRQTVPSQFLAQPMAMPLVVVRSCVEQAVFIMGQTSRCCMVCRMPQSQASALFEIPYFNMFTLYRPTCVRNRLSAFQGVQGYSAPAGRCSSALMLRCTVASRGSNCSLPNSSFGRCVDGLSRFAKALPRFQALYHSEMYIEWVPLAVVCCVRSVRFATAIIVPGGE